MNTIGQVLAWPCPSSEGEPVCIAGGDDALDSLSVNVYSSKKGTLRGVLVFDINGDLVTSAGSLPIAKVQEERAELNLPPLKTKKNWVKVETAFAEVVG